MKRRPNKEFLTFERSALSRPVLPPFEGPLTQISMRLPEGLLSRVDVIAKQTGHSRTDVLTHIIRWGCEEAEAQLRDKTELNIKK